MLASAGSHRKPESTGKKPMKQVAGAVPTRFMLECAPMGKFARLVHDFAFKKQLPTAFGIWGVISIPIAIWLFYLFASALSNAGAQGEDSGPGMIALIILFPFLLFLIRLLARPTHICVTQTGVAYCWQRTMSFYGKTLRWKELAEISVLQPRNTSRVQSRLLRFSGGGKKVDLKIDEVTEPDLLPVLFEAIRLHAPSVPRDPELQAMLGSDRANTSYTELWLKALTAPPERSRLAPLSEGTTLQAGVYKILDRIGVGGQGVAYSAARRSSSDSGAGAESGSNTVVLKEYVLPVGVSYGTKVESLEKFQREAQILGAIDHPQIVKLLDFFFEDHRGYMVLEYIEGNTLQALVSKSGALAEEQVIELALQMANILTYLHSREPAVIHRDFTPDNLMLAESGILKLIDFNVAQQKKTTATATVVGKHAYISPDQFRGQVTPQSDIYSLGASLYFLSTGCEPKPISVLHPRQKNDAVSEELDHVVATCTATESSARFVSASQLSEAVSKLKVEKLQKQSACES
jgi:hypothetical protein